MDQSEPQVRRRGFFLHSPDGEPDSGEYDNPEGVVVPVEGGGVCRAFNLAGMTYT